MSDFMLWLHANYIRPQLDAAEKGHYESNFYIVEKALSPADRISLERTFEFIATQAFLLGFRTSEGLSPLPPRRKSSAPISVTLAKKAAAKAD